MPVSPQGAESYAPLRIDLDWLVNATRTIDKFLMDRKNHLVEIDRVKLGAFWRWTIDVEGQPNTATCDALSRLYVDAGWFGLEVFGKTKGETDVPEGTCRVYLYSNYDGV